MVVSILKVAIKSLLVLLFTWALGIGCVFASSGSTNGIKIKGTIKGSQGEPVGYAHVVLEGTNKGTYTNESGEFILENCKEGAFILKVSAIGFKNIIKNIEVVPGTLVLNLNFEDDVYPMPQLTVISEKDRLLTKVPGSVSYISPKELKMLQPLSGNEVLRRVPGVHVVDEEGIGMRANIGIRGLDPDRSRNVLVLEDGVPVALSPYGEPELYYSPTIDRMEGVEVVKGSGQVLYGPQTIGGVINYVTSNPPEQTSARVKLQGGQGGFFSGLFGYGTSFGNNSGIQVNYLRKQAENIGTSEFTINDLSTKLKFQLNENSVLGIKIGFYDEVSNSTYIARTQTMYDMGKSMDFVRIAPDDRLNVRRYSVSATHEYRFNPNIKLKTTSFAYTTTRNWQRQDYALNNASNTKPANWTGVTWGDESLPGGAIYMRNSTGNRNRQFEVAGIEPKLEVNYEIGNIQNELISGVRFLYERAFEQRINGNKKDAKSGNMVEDEIRTGLAYSAYAQNKVNLSKALSISGGLRLEKFDYERDIRRNTFRINNVNVVRDTLLVNNSGLFEVIPGIGFNYRISQKVNLFGGAHRGFAPPRTKDAINRAGEVLDLEAEKSWNYELGTRTTPFKGIFLEVTAFQMNFSNQVIPVSLSSGGSGTGVINGGSTVHQGIEGALSINFGEMLGTTYSVIYEGNGSVIDSRFRKGFNESIAGNRTPYAPKMILSNAVTFETPFGLGLRFTSNYIGHQFTDPENTVSASPNGRIGELPAYHTIDGTLQYHIPKIYSTFNISVKNITNERYIATRRPEGLSVGLPRFITAGFDFKF
jgi:Fe(3+) dicitrate transport protein